MSTAVPSTAPTTVAPDALSDPGARRGRLRVAVARAARVVAPLWPIERFIAVSPWQGLTGEGFDGARAETRRWFGVDGLPGRGEARRAIAEGRLSEAELADALVATVPELGELESLRTGQVVVSPVALALADVLHGHDRPLTAPPRTVLELRRGADAATAVDAEVARWCALLVDRHHGPGRGVSNGDVWSTWRALAPHDRRLRRLAGRGSAGRGSAGSVAELPERADDAVTAALAALGVDGPGTLDELRGQLARLPGWAGYARWCDEWAADDDPAPRLGLVDLLAIRLTCDVVALGAPGRGAGRGGGDALGSAERPDEEGRITEALVAVGLDARSPGLRRGAAGVLAACTSERIGGAVLEALERRFRDDLLGRLALGGAPVEQPSAQVVCCIDVRSEGLRRHLEDLGPYDTIGFAGFFAAPLRFRAAGSAEAVPAAPALVRPEVEVREVDVAGRGAARGRRATAVATAGEVAHGAASMYALAEAAGWVLGPGALVRTLAPGPTRRRGEAPTALAVDGDGEVGFTLEERAMVAETALRTMGLTDGFAPIVVLCGHGATTTANAHASSLDCGACGGQRGGPNARAAAAILNDPAVRRELAAAGVRVPEHTWFVAAEHDTTTDEVRILADDVPDGHAGGLGQLAADLAEAGRRNAADRLAVLPGGGGSASVGVRTARRAGDWAQVRPEWGLAGNAAFVVAPRDLTRGLDLGGRVFLHSYDPDADAEATALETILTAPMVVAHWINMQYYGSTVAPGLWGAGDKTLHNPVAGIGVLEGLGCDLRPGLPWQSVAGEDGPRHEPLRLLTVVAAPVERIEAVVARNPVLQELFDGVWVHLVAVPADGAVLARRPGGGWCSLESSGPVPMSSEAVTSEAFTSEAGTPEAGISEVRA